MKKIYERQLVTEFINQLQRKYGLSIFSFVDKDSSQRVFKSGFDFLLATNHRAVFFEAKRTYNKSMKPVKDIEKTLTPFERKTAFQVALSDNLYFVIEFLQPDPYSIDGVKILLHLAQLIGPQLKYVKPFQEPLSFQEVFDFFFADLKADRVAEKGKSIEKVKKVIKKTLSIAKKKNIID